MLSEVVGRIRKNSHIIPFTQPHNFANIEGKVWDTIMFPSDRFLIFTIVEFGIAS